MLVKDFYDFGHKCGVAINRKYSPYRHGVGFECKHPNRITFKEYVSAIKALKQWEAGTIGRRTIAKRNPAPAPRREKTKRQNSARA